jgi:hypothetical protein
MRSRRGAYAIGGLVLLLVAAWLISSVKWMRDRREAWDVAISDWQSVPAEVRPTNQQIQLDKVTHPFCAPGFLWLFRERPVGHLTIFLSRNGVGAFESRGKWNSIESVRRIQQLFPESFLSVQVEQPDGSYKPCRSVDTLNAGT